MRAWIVVLLLLLGTTGAAVAESRVALVIGNSDYRRVGALPNPKNDAALVADTLRGEGFEVTLVQDATRAAMLSAMKTFAEAADRSDWAVVYYAGHGMEVGGINYLLPTDSVLREDRDVQDEAISLNRVLDSIANARKLRLVILDACRNNPFAEKMKRSVSVRAVERGLAAAEPQAGVVVVYAAAAGQTAEDGSGEHSPFTTALVKRLREPGLEVSRLFNVVTADVLDATNQHQRPYQYGSNPSREALYFAPASPTAAATDYDRVWSFLRTSQDAATLETFRDSLPAGHPLRGQVETRIAALTPAADSAAKPSVATECDQLAAAPDDPDLPPGIAGVAFARLDPQRAVRACEAAVRRAPDDRRARFEYGRALNAAANYADARIAYEVAATAGSASAMTDLGLLYAKGEGVPQNYATARGWFEKSAAAGEVWGMNNLGFLAMNGLGGPRDYAAARKWYEKAVAVGNTQSMNNLASLYLDGQGVSQDFSRARELYERAAAAGDPASVVNLGALYAKGQGVTRDYAKARELYEKAAAAGNARAMNNLGDLYSDGMGVPQNYATALDWYEQAAAAGDARAMNHVGFLYANGRGLTANFAKAREWYEKAAAAGDAWGMYNLGDFFENGRGVPRNLVTAQQWYEKAAAAGSPEAKAGLGRLAKLRHKKT